MSPACSARRPKSVEGLPGEHDPYHRCLQECANHQMPDHRHRGHGLPLTWQRGLLDQTPQSRRSWVRPSPWQPPALKAQSPLLQAGPEPYFPSSSLPHSRKHRPAPNTCQHAPPPSGHKRGQDSDHCFSCGHCACSAGSVATAHAQSTAGPAQ